MLLILLMLALALAAGLSFVLPAAAQTATVPLPAMCQPESVVPQRHLPASGCTALPPSGSGHPGRTSRPPLPALLLAVVGALCAAMGVTLRLR
jgi:hypothetical protein